ncbi:TIGR04255 family protein [Pollutimonas sp. H1-120]|uniref:TIGR04255 family protein n=1 Tax=Pollutimonas sp. H1-120 TaxID=3148824 RepID=UPI003B517292
MSRTFSNSPLVEIIAELRWGSPTIQVPGLSAVPANAHGMAPRPLDEELYLQFGSLASGEGFSQFERVIPAGFPVAPHQVVYRYRNANPAKTMLYQLGNGVFSINATPPYRSWHEFGPCVRSGLDLFQQANINLGREVSEFSLVSVRYINSFTSEMTRGASALDFINDVLGFQFGLPEILTRSCANTSEILPTLQLQLPVDAGSLSMRVGQGQVNGERAVIMDTTVSAQGPMIADPESAMEALSKARLVIHNLFIGMTGKLTDIMKPEK